MNVNKICLHTAVVIILIKIFIYATAATAMYTPRFGLVDKRGFNKEGLNYQTGDLYDDDGYNKNGYDKHGFNNLGLHELTKKKYDKRGFNVRGIHRITNSKYDERGFYKTGIHHITKKRYDNHNFTYQKLYINSNQIINPQGFKADGTYRSSGTRYSKKGYDINGFNTNNIHQVTNTNYDELGYNSNGFNSENLHYLTGNKHDQYGHDVNGFNKEGIHHVTKNIYDVNGYDVEGNKMPIVKFIVNKEQALERAAVLIIDAEYDYNDVFAGGDMAFKDAITKIYDVVQYRLGSLDKFDFHKLEQDLAKKKIAHLIIRGHGTSTTLQLGEKNEPSAIIAKNSKKTLSFFKKLSPFFRESKTSIFLHSCSTGATGVNSLAYYIAMIMPYVRVYAPTNEVDQFQLQILAIDENYIHYDNLTDDAKLDDDAKENPSLIAEYTMKPTDFRWAFKNITELQESKDILSTPDMIAKALTWLKNTYPDFHQRYKVWVKLVQKLEGQQKQNVEDMLFYIKEIIVASQNNKLGSAQISEALYQIETHGLQNGDIEMCASGIRSKLKFQLGHIITGISNTDYIILATIESFTAEIIERLHTTRNFQFNMALEKLYNLAPSKQVDKASEIYQIGNEVHVINVIHQALGLRGERRQNADHWGKLKERAIYSKYFMPTVTRSPAQINQIIKELIFTEEVKQGLLDNLVGAINGSHNHFIKLAGDEKFPLDLQHEKPEYMKTKVDSELAVDEEGMFNSYFAAAVLKHMGFIE